MQSARALRVLETLIVSRRESGLVADIDWRTLSAALGMRGRDLLIRELGRDGKEGSSEGVPPGPQAEENTAATQWLDKLRDLPLIDRNLGLLNYVSREVRQVFGMSPQDPIDECCGLFELGMDSLMSVDLKRRLESGTGLQLPDTVTLTYPSITVLAQYLGEKLFPSTDASPVQSREPLISVLSDSVAEMNEVETHAAITAELAAIQQMLGVL
jgi:acyl carrier protein